jgi:hypothetical protein
MIYRKREKWNCECCGAQMTTPRWRVDARYCSGVCRQRNYRERYASTGKKDESPLADR